MLRLCELRWERQITYLKYTFLFMHISHLRNYWAPPKNWNCREMDCPVCLEEFKPPILMLTCGHNLCGTCTKQIMDETRGQEWPCPICRKTQFKNHDIPRNWLAEQSLELSGKKSEEAIKCSQHAKRITLCEWIYYTFKKYSYLM